MALACYSNVDHEQNPDKFPLILGEFENKETGVHFQFSERLPDIEWASEYPHRIFVYDGDGKPVSWRHALVKKTVAYIVVDEDEYGKPVAERWDIKKHRLYANS